MNWIASNWYMLVIAAVVVFAVVAAVIKFVKLPTGEQMVRVKEWLKYAVTKAEQAYGSKTGELKLHSVYDAFIAKFPWMSIFISYEEFKTLVDEALKWMNEQLNNNEAFSKAIS